MFKQVVGLYIAFCPLSSFCQNLDFYGIFPMLSHTQVVNTKFDINFLAASKISGLTRRIDGVTYLPKDLEVYLQTQFSFKPNRQMSLGFAYGFQRNNPFEYNLSNEHRLAQQFLYLLSIKKKMVYQRVRFEERFIQSFSAQYTFGTRTRYQIGATMPIQNRSYLNLATEIFLITSGLRSSFLAENLSYVGIGNKVGRSNALEMGFVYNPTVRNAIGDIRSLFLLQLLWSSSVHWSKHQHHPVLHLRHY